MRNKTQIKVTRGSYYHKSSDDFIYREMTQKLVRDMPTEELKKLFVMSKINPFSKEYQDMLHRAQTPDAKGQQIQSLMDEDVILYEVVCNLP